MRIAGLAVALLAGVGCGLHYFARGDFTGTALYLAGIAFVLALLVPSWAMSLADAEALGVPLAYGGMLLAGANVAFPPQPHVAATLLALLPTLAGAMLGLGIRWIFSSESSSSLRH